jgi:transcription initiation protein SPT3
VARLKEFLSWKDLRKNARPGEEGALEAPDEELYGLAPNEDRKRKRSFARLPYDPMSGMLVDIMGADAELVEDEATVCEELDLDTRRRLFLADQMTRDMNREEYMEFSECRQASFTYKKAKKFRDWINPAQFIDFRLNDDVVEIMGFLAWEMVRKLTEYALVEKRNEVTVTSEGGTNYGEEGCKLFASPLEKTAITPGHLHAAVFRICNYEHQNIYEILLPAPLYRKRVCLF